ncbi:MAG: potassium transporter TrkG [Actinomycetaceae bacterium]|nr:potassium transporter TrkG [Actinomycetaceae bacterium]
MSLDFQRGGDFLLTADSRWERFKLHVDRIAKQSPARLALVVFALIIGFITALLLLPWATSSGKRAPFVDALFTATSAVCVTGLTVVDSADYWSVFGKIVIAVGIKIGGLGVMTLASILALAVSRHIGLTQRMLAATETKTDSLGAVGSLITAVIITSTTMEGLIFLTLLPRFLTLHYEVAPAVGHALFMAVSTFNNAGFVIMPEGLGAYVSDWWMIMPVAVGTAVGALGFPVVLDLARHWRTPRLWTLHTKMTLATYFLLMIFAAAVVGASEWDNPGTFGKLPTHAKVLSAILMGVNSRSSGMSSINIGEETRATWLLQDILMFIGGGSASTAGGIKVTTLAVMILAIVAEARGDRDIEAYGRRIPPQTVRLAVAVVSIGSLLVAVSTFTLLNITDYSLDVVSFDVISAFATVGLSTGITPHLPIAGKYLLTALMFAGRTGTMTVAAALALRERRRVIRMPEERPAIG